MFNHRLIRILLLIRIEKFLFFGTRIVLHGHGYHTSSKYVFKLQQNVCPSCHFVETKRKIITHQQICSPSWQYYVPLVPCSPLFAASPAFDLILIQLIGRRRTQFFLLHSQILKRKNIQFKIRILKTHQHGFLFSWKEKKNIDKIN